MRRYKLLITVLSLALPVGLGISAYTMSTLANRLTGAPVDPQLSQFALSGPRL